MVRDSRIIYTTTTVHAPGPSTPRVDGVALPTDRKPVLHACLILSGSGGAAWLIQQSPTEYHTCMGRGKQHSYM